MRKSNRSRLWAAALGFLAAFGGVGVLTTGLWFDGVEMFTVAAACALAAAVIAVCAPLRGFPAVPGILSLACIWLWRRGPLNRSVEALLHQVSSLYDMGYDWGILRWSEEPLSTADATLALCLIGILIALAVTWSVARGRGTWLAAIASFLPLVPCMVLTDTVPSAFYLYLQLLSIVMLLLTHGSRKRDARQGNTLLTLVALPAALALGLLFLVIPQEDYNGRETAEHIINFFEDLLSEEDPDDTTQTLLPVPIERTDVQVNLSTVGVNRAWEIPVMEVLAEQTGTLYLRGAAYDIYSGTTWDIDEETVNHAFYCDDTLQYSVTVSTKNLHDLLYMPYVPVALYSGDVLLDRYISGRTDNTGNLKEYTVTYHPALKYSESESDSSETEQDMQVITGDDSLYISRVWDDLDEKNYAAIMPGLNGQVSGSPSVPEKYLQLDDDTMAAAQALLARELPELEETNTPWAKATLIINFVKNSADYDLSTHAMPALEDDFALWFLEESDTGYCIHFATAATVLLRAAEVPARYVTGYLVDARANETVTVMQKNSHAWVECYIPGAGWIILEPTPSDGVDETAGRETTVPTETTVHSDVTEPPASSETVDPSVQTAVPENTTGGSGQTLPIQDGNTSGIGGADGPAQQHQRLVLPPWLKVLLILAAVIAAVIGQWKLRVMLRQKKWQRGSYNAQALARWQDIVRYARLLETEPDPKLHELAQKAKFSQHRLTKEELKAFEFALGDSRRTLWRMSRWKRLLATLIYALY